MKGLGGSKLAMPVEVVQFCWKYNAERLKNLPELAGCEVHRFTNFMFRTAIVSETGLFGVNVRVFLA